MKHIKKIILLVAALCFIMTTYSQNMVASRVYKFPKNLKNTVMMAGETPHFSAMTFQVETLKNSDTEKTIHNKKQEQIIIIKAGELEVKLDRETKIIGNQSVIFIHPRDTCYIKSKSPKTIYYTMIYQAKQPVDLARGVDAGSSFIIDFNTLKYKTHDKGGIRNYFRTKTAMCSYYEMHVTNLNAGIKSHEPHTHFASEIILIISGNTEMEIGDHMYKANEGDVYFVGSDVPHAIKNTGNAQCMYFAYQWN